MLKEFTLREILVGILVTCILAMLVIITGSLVFSS